MLGIKKRNNTDLFTDIAAQAQYVFVYRLFKNGKIEVVYDNSGGKINAKLFSSKKDVHALSHKKAFENKRVVYSWFLTSQEASFFESTLIPLEDNLGQVESLFCLVKVLEGISSKKEKDFFVAEDVGESFAHLLMKAREAEKREIAAAFHDEVGSGAVLLNSTISILKNILAKGDVKAAVSKVRELEDIVLAVSQRMRKIIISVRPPQLKEMGLRAAIGDLIESLSQSSNINFEFSCNIDDKEKISEEVKFILYRCVQESINNIFKHARANNVLISLEDKKTSVLLTVKDDGIGYEESKSNSVKKMGLLGMREGASCVGGTFDIKGKKGKGTVISMLCPKISYSRRLYDKSSNSR